MGKIEFKACRVTMNKKTENYKDFTIEINEVVKTEWDNTNKYCKFTMADGNIIEVTYFDKTAAL